MQDKTPTKCREETFSEITDYSLLAMSGGGAWSSEQRSLASDYGWN